MAWPILGDSVIEGACLVSEVKRNEAHLGDEALCHRHRLTPESLRCRGLLLSV